MQIRFFKIIFIGIILSLGFVSNINVVYGQCGIPGTSPCKTTQNKTPKIRSKTLPSKKNSNTKVSSKITSRTKPSIPFNGIDGIWVINFRYKEYDDWEGRTDVRLKQFGEKLIVSSKAYQGEYIVGIWEKEPTGKIEGNKITINMKNNVTWYGIVDKSTMRGTNNQGATWTAKRNILVYNSKTIR
jgi:hypothetical protein